MYSELWFGFVVVVGSVFTAVILWWALADLFHATMELPFAALLERWRHRAWLSRDERGGDAGAHASA
jgi:hypothetical protein